LTWWHLTRWIDASLSSNFFAEPIDLMFVFEINAFMSGNPAVSTPHLVQWKPPRHPIARVMPAKRVLLYPTCAVEKSCCRILTLAGHREKKHSRNSFSDVDSISKAVYI
jgi:hypothetical protein